MSNYNIFLLNGNYQEAGKINVRALYEIAKVMQPLTFYWIIAISLLNWVDLPRLARPFFALTRVIFLTPNCRFQVKFPDFKERNPNIELESVYRSIIGSAQSMGLRIILTDADGDEDSSQSVKTDDQWSIGGDIQSRLILQHDCATQKNSVLCEVCICLATKWSKVMFLGGEGSHL